MVDTTVKENEIYKLKNSLITGPLDMLSVKNIRNLMTLRRCAFKIMSEKAIPL